MTLLSSDRAMGLSVFLGLCCGNVFPAYLAAYPGPPTWACVPVRGRACRAGAQPALAVALAGDGAHAFAVEAPALQEPACAGQVLADVPWGPEQALGDPLERLGPHHPSAPFRQPQARLRKDLSKALCVPAWHSPCPKSAIAHKCLVPRCRVCHSLGSQ